MVMRALRHRTIPVQGTGRATISRERGGDELTGTQVVGGAG